MNDFQKHSKLPDAAIPLLRYLQDSGKKTQRQLINSLNLPTRTVRYSIRRLLERGLIKKVPNLKDMRSVYYLIDSSVLDVEQVIAEELRVSAKV